MKQTELVPMIEIRRVTSLAHAPVAQHLEGDDQEFKGNITLSSRPPSAS